MADDLNQEALAIEVYLNLPSPRIIRVLDRAADWRDYPSKIYVDNGPEFISIAVADGLMITELTSRLSSQVSRPRTRRLRNSIERIGVRCCTCMSLRAVVESEN